MIKTFRFAPLSVIPGLILLALLIQLFNQYIRTTLYQSNPNLSLTVNTAGSNVTGNMFNLTHAQVVLKNGREAKYGEQKYIDTFKEQYFTATSPSPAASPSASPSPSLTPSPTPSLNPSPSQSANSPLIADDQDASFKIVVEEELGHVKYTRDPRGEIVDDIRAFLGRFRIPQFENVDYDFNPQTDKISWTFPQINPGDYDVYLTWPQGRHEEVKCEMVEGSQPHSRLRFDGICQDDLRSASNVGRLDQSRPPEGPIMDGATWQKLGQVKIEDGRNVEFRLWPGKGEPKAAWTFKNIPAGEYRLQYHWVRQQEKIYPQYGYAKFCQHEDNDPGGPSVFLSVTDSPDYFRGIHDEAPTHVVYGMDNGDSGWTDLKIGNPSNNQYAFNIEKGDIVTVEASFQCLVSFPADAVRLIGTNETYEIDNSDAQFHANWAQNWNNAWYKVTDGAAVKGDYLQLTGYGGSTSPVADAVRLVPSAAKSGPNATIANKEVHLNNGEDIKLQINNIDPSDVVCAYVLQNDNPYYADTYGFNPFVHSAYLGDVYGNIRICSPGEIPRAVSDSALLSAPKTIRPIDILYTRRYQSGPGFDNPICPSPYPKYNSR